MLSRNKPGTRVRLYVLCLTEPVGLSRSQRCSTALLLSWVSIVQVELHRHSPTNRNVHDSLIPIHHSFAMVPLDGEVANTIDDGGGGERNKTISLPLLVHRDTLRSRPVHHICNIRCHIGWCIECKCAGFIETPALRMTYIYTPRKKFDTIRISELRNIIKI